MNPADDIQPKPKKMGAGFGVMILRDNKVLLGQRHPDPVKADSLMNGEGTWTMPGGKLDFGESFEAGAVREVSEEIGIKIQESDLEVISLSNDIVPTAHFVTIGLLCKVFPKDLEPRVMEPDEITQWKWFALDELPSPLFKPSQKVLDNYKEGKFYKN
ncbi:MAG: NUDIX domain-containing protein [Candidatus Pacebacteria bacterium]|nr:NUDIX domain-containing protein [Candidatus Paceibacterota bacterium]